MNVYLSIILMISGLVLLALGILGFQHNEKSGSKAFSFLMFAMAIHTIGYGLELLSPNLEVIYIWVRVEYLGVAFYPFLIYCFVRDYSGEKKFANRYMMAIVFGISLVTFILVQTNASHHCYYQSLELDMSLGFPTLLSEKAFWYNIQAGILYFSTGYALIVLGHKIINTRGQWQRRLIFVFIGILLPVLAMTFYLLGPQRVQIDLVPFSYLFVGLFIAYGLYRYDILSFSEVTHEVIFNAIDEAVIVVGHEGTILKMNPASQRLFDKLDQIKIGQAIKHCPSLDQVLATKKTQLLSLGDRHYQVRQIPIEKNAGYIVVLTDMTEITEAQKQLEILANTDQLTTLYNRHYFREYFEQLEEEGIIMLMDIDNFKEVNDQYGHLAGDGVLGEVAQCLKEHFDDGMICRYGGEEFIILLENEDLARGKDRGEAFRKAFFKRTTDYPCTITIGICAYKKGNYSDTMKLVDKLLYHGKNTGRNCVVVE